MNSETLLLTPQDPAVDHVLVVDDDPSTIEMMEVVLRLAGHEVRSAASATEALTAAHRDQPRAVLLDVMLPGMSGLELLEVMRSDPRTREVPVLLFSAWAGAVDTWSAIARGANGYLSKPLDVETLVAEVERILADSSKEGTEPSA